MGRNPRRHTNMYGLLGFLPLVLPKSFSGSLWKPIVHPGQCERWGTSRDLRRTAPLPFDILSEGKADAELRIGFSAFSIPAKTAPVFTAHLAECTIGTYLLFGLD